MDVVWQGNQQPSSRASIEARCTLQEDADPRVNLAAAAALLDRVGLGKGATAPAPASLGPDARNEFSARFRRMSDAALEQEVARLEEEAARGRVVILPAEDAATG